MVIYQDMGKTILTIVTTTYNRADLLLRLYQSIRSQPESNTEVKWLVIDDGSTDQTRLYLEQWVALNPTWVAFKSIPNGGKCYALNHAAELVDSPWLMIVDSDDYLLPGALRLVLDAVSAIENPNIGMLAGLLRIVDRPDHQFRVASNPCSYIEWRRTQKLFDFVPIIRADLVRKYPYPVVGGEKYMAEGWRYEKIAETHLIKFLNKQLVVADYMADGLSAGSLRIRVESPNNAMIVYSHQYVCDYGVTLKWRSAINYWRFWIHAKLKGVTTETGSRPPCVFIIPAFLVYLHDVSFLRQ